MRVQWDSTAVIYRLQETYDWVRREVLYSIPTEFDIRMKQVGLIKMCLMKPVVKSA